MPGGAGSRKAEDDQFVLAYSILGPADRGATRGCGAGDEDEDGARLEEEEEDSSDDDADEEEAEAETVVEKAALGRMEATPLRIPVRLGTIILADMLRLTAGE